MLSYRCLKEDVKNPQQNKTHERLNKVIKMLVGTKVELVNAYLSDWFVEKNSALLNVCITTQWFLQIIKETEKAIQVVIFDERKNQTAESSKWFMWLPKSVCGFLNN